MKKKILRKQWNRAIAVLLLLTCLALMIPTCQPDITKQQEVIIDYAQQDKLTFSLVSLNGSPDYGDLFVVEEEDDNGDWHRIYDNNFLELKPWKLELADVDGDGTKEIIIAVRKTTHFDQQERNRLFIFNFDGEKLYKKWTGSQIAGNWTNFYVGDLLSIPGDELIFIQQLENKEERLCIYYWLEFGFVQLAESDSYNQIENFKITGDNRIEITHRIRNKTENISLTVKNGKITEGEEKQ